MATFFEGNAYALRDPQQMKSGGSRANANCENRPIIEAIIECYRTMVVRLVGALGLTAEIA
jgi:hypothetical protein